jgi:hypothetical protein
MEDAEISFATATPADASRLAEDLARFIQTSVDGAEASVGGGSSDSMDFGTTVVLVLGTPAMIALAHGVASWIKRQGDPELVIKTKNGSVTVKGGLDLDAKRDLIIAAFDKGAL